MQVVMKSPDALKPHPRNSKLHPKEQIEKIAASISKFGFNNPVIIDSSETILAGHGRVQAAKSLGMTEIPTISLEHLSPEEARAFIIADNKVSESGYDTEILCEELFELSQAGFDGVEMGFNHDELEGLMKFDAEKQAEDLSVNENASRIKVRAHKFYRVGDYLIYATGKTVKAEHVIQQFKREMEKSCMVLTTRTAQLVIDQLVSEGLEAEESVINI